MDDGKKNVCMYVCIYIHEYIYIRTHMYMYMYVGVGGGVSFYEAFNPSLENCNFPFT